MSKKDENKRRIRRRLVGSYVWSVVSTSLLLLLCALSSLLLINARSISSHLKESLSVSVLFKPEVSEKAATSWMRSVELLPFVREVEVIGREQGREELSRMLGEDFLESFSLDVIPVSSQVGLKAEYVCADSLDTVTRLLGVSPLVESVDCSFSLIEALDTNLAKISFALALFIALLLAVSCVLIANMVRLSVFSNRFTINTMNLVGASRSFILRPFVGRAVVQALLSSFVCCAVVAVLLSVLKRSLPELYSVISLSSILSTSAIVLASSLLLCTLSTLVVVNTLLNAPKDDLYC